MGTRWEQLPWGREHPKTHSNPGVVSWGALSWEPGRLGCSCPKNGCSAPKQLLTKDVPPLHSPEILRRCSPGTSITGAGNLPACCGQLHLISAKALFNLTHLLDFLMAPAAGGSSKDRRASPALTGWCPRCWGSPASPQGTRGQCDNMNPEQFQPPGTFCQPNNLQWNKTPLQGLWLHRCSPVGSAQASPGERRPPAFPKFAFSSAKVP